MIRWKQNEQEYSANITKVEQKLLPAKLAATVSNGQLLANWLIKNCAEGDVVDASVPNILEAIAVLDKARSIDWEVAPTKTPQKKKPDFLQSREGSAVNHARENQISEIDIAMAQEKKRREALGDAANDETLSLCHRLVGNHSSSSHSRTNREKAVLKAEFDRLVAARVHPKDLLAALQAKQDTFANGDVTRPRFGNK
jgi:hypothetical protein